MSDWSTSLSATGLSRRVATGAACFLGAVVAVVNVSLVRENASLRSRIAEPPPATIVANHVSDLTGIDMDGQLRRITFDSRRQYLVFTFSPNCPFCKASLSDWRGLATRLDLSRWSVIWVSRDSLEMTKPFAETERLNAVVLADVTQRLYRQLGLASVPQTVLLSSTGDVIRVVRGATNANKLAEVSGILDAPFVSAK